MIPGDVVGLILLLAAIAPGYVFVRVAERYGPRPDRSALMETAEILAIGAACTTVAALLVIAAGELIDGLVLDPVEWSSRGNTYLRSRPYRLARSAGFVLVGACILAGVAARCINRGRPATFVPGVTVRGGVFEPTSRGQRAWVAVHLKHGAIIEGYLLAYPTGSEDSEEIALHKPIGLTENGKPRALVAGVDRVVIPGDEIAMVGVRFHDD